ncbi:MAG: caspase family protein [Betaproteobacteria bacterium]
MMVLRMRWMAGLLAMVALNAIPQNAEPAKPAKLARLALVIGNAAYKDDKLLNPVNDALDMAALLKQSGFEVIHRENASLREMHLALREFGDRLGRETLGLLFFAGHGVQVRGRNYLLGVDADIGREDEVAFNALDLQAVLEKMDTARNHTNLIILDACRNNPFASRFKLTNNGLAQIDAPPGTVVAFSTAPGSVAADGTGRNGLYTQHLLAQLGKPGVRIEDAFKQVRVAVRKDSNGLQTPWESTSLESELILKRLPPKPVVKPAPTSSKAPVVALTRAKSTQPGAAPRFEIGDTWEWRITDQITGEVRTRKRKVTAITGDTVTYDNGAVTDLSGNTVSEKVGDKVRTYTPSTFFYVFPLTVGLAWSGITVEEIAGSYISDLNTKISGIAEEEIETPAGRFKTIKVERVANWKNRGNGKTGVSIWTYWYASAAKSAVRYERSRTGSDGRVLNRETHELIAFSVK